METTTRNVAKGSGGAGDAGEAMVEAAAAAGPAQLVELDVLHGAISATSVRPYGRDVFDQCFFASALIKRMIEAFLFLLKLLPNLIMMR